MRQVEAAGVDHVALVAHSLAGINVPGVAAELGSRRVRRIVFVACNVPRQRNQRAAQPEPAHPFLRTNGHKPAAVVARLYSHQPPLIAAMIAAHKWHNSQLNI
ncbi:alpha/beta hydrolase [Mycobacterium europaeum]|uniref:alpha/beta hydrolase n=1 Tax=Mycobacterium europaeum TaxID=761804 RepID=UPI003D6AF797